MNIHIPIAIAKDEWRYWARSRLALFSCLVAALLVVASLVSTVARIESERDTRESFQQQARETFESQPARHPHRMVHYGHYVFRAPAPLSLIDPGVDAHTGTVMFLEGHRQNSAVFSPHYASAQAGPYAELSPAFAYQALLPLLLIVLGFAAIPREREAKTDYLLYAAAVTPTQVWLGKSLALAGAAGASLAPLVIGLAIALGAGESPLIAAYMLAGYALYLLAWVFLVTAVSAWCTRASTALALLLACWTLLCVIAPPVAATAAQTLAPMDGKIATDLAVVRALRDTGDGHNANDPAFAKLRAQLLEQYGVDDVADLPVNFRGMVAQWSEAKQTEVMNVFADEKMADEAAQSQVVRRLSLLSPALAFKNFSKITAGTDLSQHHAFLRDAERVRFDFVQKLNTIHAEKLAYADDMQRSSSPEAERRTRMSAANWRMLEEVSARPQTALVRISASLPQLLIALLWCAVMACIGLLRMNRRPQDAA